MSSAQPPPTTRKSLLTPNGVTYGYSTTPPSSVESANKPTIFFLHGHPDNRTAWDSQVVHFTKLGYGAIVPDMLGYGETDKPDPEDVGEYRYKKMAESLVGILDEEGVEKVIVAAHDWGVPLATRLALYYPEKIIANIWTCVVYFPPSPIKTDLKTINHTLKGVCGFQPFAYWEFMIKPTSPSLMRQNIQSTLSILFPKNFYPTWRSTLCEPGKFEAWVTSNKTCEVAEWLTPRMQDEFKTRMTRDGFPLNWYRAHAENWNWEDELQFTGEKAKITTPVLQIVTTQDPVSLPGNVEISRPYLKDLTVEKVDAGHWLMMEKPEEWNRVVEKFLVGKGI